MPLAVGILQLRIRTGKSTNTKKLQKNICATRVAHGLRVKTPLESYSIPNAAQESIASVAAELFQQKP